MKIGICTTGGDCSGLNAAIYAAYKHAKAVKGVDVVGIQGSLSSLLSDQSSLMKLDQKLLEWHYLSGGTLLGTSSKGNPFRTKKDGKFDEILVSRFHENLKKHDLDAVILIGGEGSHSIAATLCETGAPIVGIPKTIDNDVPCSDNAIGFETAADVVSQSIERIRSTADSHNRIFALEVMGRNSGFLTLHGGLAARADALLLPEFRIDLPKLCTHIEKTFSRGAKSFVMAVAEGAYLKGEKPVFQKSESTKKRLGGIAAKLEMELQGKFQADVRSNVLGHMQRGGKPSRKDLELALSLGSAAMASCLEGKKEVFIGTCNGSFKTVPYAHYPKSKQKKVDESYPLFQIAKQLNIFI